MHSRNLSHAVYHARPHSVASFFAMAPPQLRVICPPVVNIGVTEPFVVRLDPSTSKPLGHAVLSTFRSKQPIVQVFQFDGVGHSLLDPEMFTVVNSAYTGSDAFVVHMLFREPHATFRALHTTFQLRFTWSSLKLNTVSAPFKLENSSIVDSTIQSPIFDATNTLDTTITHVDKRAKRKRIEEATHECTCLQHVTMLQEQVTLMREEILGYRALLNDTLVKYMKPLEKPLLAEPLELSLSSCTFLPDITPPPFENLDPLFSFHDI